MARVFDSPGYINQVCNRVAVLLRVGASLEPEEVLAPKLRGSAVVDYGAFLVGFDRDDPNIAVFREYFAGNSTALYALDSKMPDNVMLSRSLPLAEIIEAADDIYTDHDAAQYVVARLCYPHDKCVTFDNTHSAAVYGAQLAKDFVMMSSIGDKISPSSIHSAVRGLKLARLDNGWGGVLANRGDACEFLRMSGDKSYKTSNLGVDASSFEVRCATLYETLGVKSVHKVAGLTAFTFAIDGRNVTSIVDHKGLDQIHLCVKAAAGMWESYANHRWEDPSHPDRKRAIAAFRSCATSVFGHINRHGPADGYAKHMKTALALVLNDFHSKAESLDLGGLNRSRELEAECYMKEPHEKAAPLMFQRVIKRLDVSDRVKVDMAYFFHCLPAPDCDPAGMFASVVKKLHESNPVDAPTFDRFIAYAKSYLLTRVCAKTLGKCTIETDDGYELDGKDWWESCKRGRVCMPPDAEHGKAWLSKHFSFDAVADRWFLDAKDVTHIMADTKWYWSNDKDRADSSELLYAVAHAPLLSGKFLPSVVRDLVLADRVDELGDIILDVAAKSENTKFGSGTRETYSGCDVAREITTEFEHNLKPVAAVGHAIALRMDDSNLKRKQATIAQQLVIGSKTTNVVVSLDVSGWSTNASREHLLKHHDTMMEAVDAPDGFSLKNLWKHFRLAINKRGVKLEGDGDSGAFQGFTGTADTIMHQNMVYYCIHSAKAAGILRNNEAAAALVLIDDGVIQVPLDNSRTPEDKQRTADTFYNHVCMTYKKLGYRVDNIKGMVSTFKYVFLNKFYSGGSEVVCPSKVYAKADKEFARRFATIGEQFDTVCSSFASASSKGADPYLCYYSALSRCFMLAARTADDIRSYGADKLCAVAMAPRSLGGWGIPTLMSFFTKERTDSLCGWLGTLSQMRKYANMPNGVHLEKLAKSVEVTVHSLTSAPFRVPPIDAILSDPYAVRNTLSVDPGRGAVKAVHKVFERCDKGPYFSDIWKIQGCAATSKAVGDAVSSITMHAAVAEEIGACLPSRIFDSITKAAIDSEIIATQLKFADRTKVIADLRSDNAKFLIAGLKAPIKPNAPRLDHYYDIAHDLRESFLHSCGVNFTNHTRPDPWHSYDNVGDIGAGIVISAPSLSPISCPGSDKDYSSFGSSISSYRNLFDGFIVGGTKGGVKVKGIIDIGSATNKSKDLVGRAAARAAAISAHVNVLGGNGDAIWELISACWGSQQTISNPGVSSSIKTNVSAKRLGTAHHVRSHAIWAYPNCPTAISIDATTLGRAKDIMPNQMDYLATITCAKVRALLDLQMGVTAKVYFGAHPEVLDVADPTTSEVTSAIVFEGAVETLCNEATGSVRDAWEAVTIRKTEVSWGDIDADDDDVTDIATRSIRVSQLGMGVYSVGGVANVLGRMSDITINTPDFTVVDTGVTARAERVKRDGDELNIVHSVHAKAPVAGMAELAFCLRETKKLFNESERIRALSFGINEDGLASAGNIAFDVKTRTIICGIYKNSVSLTQAQLAGMGEIGKVLASGHKSAVPGALLYLAYGCQPTDAAFSVSSALQGNVAGWAWGSKRAEAKIASIRSRTRSQRSNAEETDLHYAKAIYDAAVANKVEAGLSQVLTDYIDTAARKIKSRTRAQAGIAYVAQNISKISSLTPTNVINHISIVHEFFGNEHSWVEGDMPQVTKAIRAITDDLGTKVRVDMTKASGRIGIGSGKTNFALNMPASFAAIVDSAGVDLRYKRQVIAAYCSGKYDVATRIELSGQPEDGAPEAAYNADFYEAISDELAHSGNVTAVVRDDREL